MTARQNNEPPKLANWLAKKLIGSAYIEELMGDLKEIYEDRLSSKGKAYAILMYWVDSFHLWYGFSSVRIFKTQNNNTIMLKNMFKIAWRNAIRQKQFTCLNLMGLALGITACLLISMYVIDEMSFDRFHTKSDRIYRINQPNIWGNWEQESASTGPNVSIALKTDIPDFEEITRLRSMTGLVIKYEEEGKGAVSFEEDYNFSVDENFFKVFSFDFMYGSPETALKEPKSVIMTWETAQRYFGFVNPINKTVQIKHYDGTWNTYVVSAVLKDIPERSHLQFDMLIPMSSHKDQLDRDDWKWIWTAFSTYGLVQEGTDIAALTEKLQAVPPKWAPPTTEKIFNQSFEEFTEGNPWFLRLQPLKDIYFADAPKFHRFGPTGNPQLVYIFSVIGFLIILLSVINFMNLSTARSANRAKEVGIRKVLGSGRQALITQFIFESLLYVLISGLLSILLIELLLPAFNNFSEKELSLVTFISEPWIAMAIGGAVLSVGLLAGSYPALYLSASRPIDTLKGKLSQGFKGKKIRNALVIVQFSISIGLIICAFFVQKQIAYTSNLDVGFSKENILQIHNIEQLGFDTEVLKTKLKANSSFSYVAKSFGVPPNIWSGDRYKASKTGSDVVYMSNVRTDEDFIHMLDLKFVAGSNFDPEKSGDKYKVIINEEAAKTLGWNADMESVIGKKVYLASGDEDDFEVIGVLKDFNFQSVRRRIQPLMIIHHLNDEVWDYGSGNSFFSLKIKAGSVINAVDMARTIEGVKRTILEIDPSFPFEYSFVDQDFENTFRSEQRMGTIMNLFTGIAIIIACLGLFGLAAFTAEQRLKELGIRKVLGASVRQLVILFTREFTILIIVAALVATPIAYYFIDQWLSNFAFKTPIDPWVFLVVIGGVLGLAMITIGYQSILAASRNPVDTLKDE